MEINFWNLGEAKLVTSLSWASPWAQQWRGAGNEWSPGAQCEALWAWGRWCLELKGENTQLQFQRNDFSLQPLLFVSVKVTLYLKKNKYFKYRLTAWIIYLLNTRLVLTEEKSGLLFHFYVLVQFFISLKVGVKFKRSLPPVSC